MMTDDSDVHATTLADAYPNVQARCREVLADYKALGPTGAFGAAVIEDVLRRADRAAASGDVVAMAASYREMLGVE